MPVWMEILLNVLGYAGFIAMATLHRSPEKTMEAGADGVSSSSSPRPRCASAYRP